MDTGRRTILQFFASTLALPSWLGQRVEAAEVTTLGRPEGYGTTKETFPPVELDDATLALHAQNLVRHKTSFYQQHLGYVELAQGFIFQYWKALPGLSERCRFFDRYLRAVTKAAGICIHPHYAECCKDSRPSFVSVRLPDMGMSYNVVDHTTNKYSADVEKLTEQEDFAQCVWAPIEHILDFLRQRTACTMVPQECMPLTIVNVDHYVKAEAYYLEWVSRISYVQGMGGYSGDMFYQSYPLSAAQDLGTLLSTIRCFLDLYGHRDRLYIFGDNATVNHIGDTVYDEMVRRDDPALETRPKRWDAINYYFRRINALLVSDGADRKSPALAAFELQTPGFSA